MRSVLPHNDIFQITFLFLFECQFTSSVYYSAIHGYIHNAVSNIST